MRKIKIFEHISLDGVIEHDGDYEYGAWTAPYRSQAGLEILLNSYGTNFDLLLGRRTYDAWSAYWPKAGDNPMANLLNAATKYVATNRPGSLEWDPVKDLGEDIIAGIRNLKLTDGPDLVVWGSSTLTSLLLNEGLANDLIFIVYPVLLGRGKRILSDSVDACELEFVNSQTTPTGLLFNTYKYVGALKNKLL